VSLSGGLGVQRDMADAGPGKQNVGRIDPNVISPDGFWCSFSVLEGEITDEGIFPMNSHRFLSRVIQRTSGSAGSSSRAPSARTVRTWATRGIVALALVLGGLGAAMSVSPGHASHAHVHASAPHRLPWMY
jgi:hypothetical protein